MKIEDVKGFPKEFETFFAFVDSNIYCGVGDFDEFQPIEVDMLKPNNLIYATELFVSLLMAPILEHCEEEAVEECLDFILREAKNGIVEGFKAAKNLDKYRSLKSYLKESGHEELLKDLDSLMGGL